MQCPIKVGDKFKYQDQGAQASVSCKDCPPGYHQDAAGAASCKVNVCTCPSPGTAATGTDCTTHGDVECATY